MKLVKKKKISPRKIQQSVSTNTTSEEPASIPYSNTSLSTNFALDSMETSQVTSTSANPVSAVPALCVSATDLLNNVVPIIQSQDSSASSASSSSTFQTCVTAKDSKTCSHSTHCVARQPLPPPPEKCSILCHTGSKYHEHMASETGVPSRYGTHEYCMRIEYENYGCEDCIWFKKWGFLHGYPDISPRSYREHLQPLTNL